MNPSRVEGIVNRTAAAVVLCATVVVGSVDVSLAQTTENLPLYAPAELVRSMRLPGSSDEIGRPLALHVDRLHGEIYVGDSMSNRIVIFDRDGLYRYQFDCADHIGTPQGIAVDSEGIVFVLGTSREGQRIVKFDFDGMYLGVVDIGGLGLRQTHGFTIDDEDHLLLVGDDAKIHVVTREGEPVRRIDVGSVVPEEDRSEMILGRPVARDGQVWIPASTLGHVLVFDLETGQYMRSVGVRGNTPGQLNFPAAVDVTSEGIVAVLDQMRFAVVCYSTDGRFLGEFGGKGFRDGWFYNPSLLAVSDDDHVVVGQMLDGRIQLCSIPRYVRTRFVQASATRPGDDEEVDGIEARTEVASGATLQQP